MEESPRLDRTVELKAVGYLMLTAVLWGGVFHVIKYPLSVAPPFVVLFTRFFLSGLYLLPHLLRDESYRLLWKRENRRELVFLALVGIVSYNICFTFGMKLTDPATGSLIIAANPVMTTLLARFWESERVSALRWLGIVLSFGGLAFLVFEGDLSRLVALRVSVGSVILLGAPLCWAVYSVRSRRILSRVPIGSFTAAVVILSLPAQLAGAAAQNVSWQWAGDSTFWLAIVYLSILSTGVAYMFWNRGVSLIGAPRSAVFMNLVPVTALLIAAVLGQPLLLHHLLGGAVVLAGVFLATRR